MRAFVIVSLFFICSGRANAQDRLIELKLGGAAISTEIYNYDGFYYGSGYDVEVHYYIKSKLAVGAFYTRSFNFLEEELSGAFIEVIGNNYSLTGNTSTLQYGLSARYSSRREKRFSVYGTVCFYRLQNVYDFEEEVGFKIGDEGFAAGIGGGLGLKISRTIGWHMLEITYNHYVAGMDFTKEYFGLGEVHIKSGLVFNIMERK